jgi:hypothetical protein
MLAEITKKNDEQVWASVFVASINQDYGFDYTLVPERTEESPVDMYAVSKSEKFPKLSLQLTHAVELPFIAYETPQTANYSKQPTVDAIERKYEKLTRQRAKLEELILVVQGYMNLEMAKATFADEDFLKYRAYPFAGIYYVVPPMFSGESDETLQDGLVMEIKDAFKNI